MDDVNYTTVTNKWYAQQMYFPFNLRYVNRRRHEALEVLRIIYPGEHVTMRDIETAVSVTRIEGISLSCYCTYF